jgi:hypothetical protein
VLVRSDTDAEVDVRPGVLGLSARPDRADAVAFADGGSFPDFEVADVRQGHGIAVGGRNRHRQAVRRHRSGERDHPTCRRTNRLGVLGADVDAAVLPPGVWIRSEDEWPEYRACDRPRPRRDGRNEDQRRRTDDERSHDATDQEAPVVKFENCMSKA